MVDIVIRSLSFQSFASDAIQTADTGAGESLYRGLALSQRDLSSVRKDPSQVTASSEVKDKFGGTI